MSLQTQVTVFNGKMERSFLRAVRVMGEQAPYNAITSTKPGNARITFMPFMGPTGGMVPYEGRRFFGKVDPNLYTMVAQEFNDGFTVDLRDVEDDMVGGYPDKIAEMVENGGEVFRSHEVFKVIANGETIPCFDQSNFFSATHTLGGFPSSVPAGFGGAGNLLTYSAAATSDAKQYQILMFVTTNRSYLPVLLLNNKPLKYHTDAGSSQSFKAKKIDYWLDTEISLGLTFWYDALKVTVTNTPDLNDLKDIFDGMETYMRGFTLQTPPDAPPRWAHGQTDFENPKNITIAVGQQLRRRIRHLMRDVSVSVTPPGNTGGIVNSNLFFGSYNVVSANELDL